MFFIQYPTNHGMLLNPETVFCHYYLTIVSQTLKQLLKPIQVSDLAHISDWDLCSICPPSFFERALLDHNGKLLSIFTYYCTVQYTFYYYHILLKALFTLLMTTITVNGDLGIIKTKLGIGFQGGGCGIFVLM